MTTNSFLRRGWLRTALLAIAVLTGAVLVGRGAEPAYASHTEILVSKSSTSATAVSGITLIVNGFPQTVYAWAKDVDDPQGAGGFDVKFKYNNSLIEITALQESSAWLGSTTRSVACPAPAWATDRPYVHAILGDPDGLWEGHVGCTTLSPPPPYGPTGNGLLATITIKPRSTILASPTKLDLTHGSKLIDTGDVVGETVYPPEVIPALIRSLNVRIVHCADFDNSNSVSLQEVLALAGRFGMSNTNPSWHPQYDLNEDGAVGLSDVLDGAAQFGLNCRPVA